MFDLLEVITTALMVDQERLSASPRLTVGTVTDATTMLRVLFARIGSPNLGSPTAFSFNQATVSAQGARTIEKKGAAKKEVVKFKRQGGMCPECEGLGRVSDIDLAELFDKNKTFEENPLTIPGYKGGGWNERLYRESGFFPVDVPIKDFTEQQMQDFFYKEPTRMKIAGINMTYEGLIPRLQKSMLAKESSQTHIQKFIERAVTFTICPACQGTRLNDQALSSRILGTNIAQVCSLHITDASVAPLVANLCRVLDSFVKIGLGYLSLDRPASTLSGGEAQRAKMIRHLGSALTDVTYIFDEPTAGLHPHDIGRMNQLLIELRDKGNTVLVVEHKPETIAIADHVIDLGPGAGTAGGQIMYEGSFEGLRASDTITGKHLDDRLGPQGRRPPAHRPCRDSRRLSK